jgi:hypothetical protein
VIELGSRPPNVIAMTLIARRAGRARVNIIELVTRVALSVQRLIFDAGRMACLALQLRVLSMQCKVRIASMVELHGWPFGR